MVYTEHDGIGIEYEEKSDDPGTRLSIRSSQGSQPSVSTPQPVVSVLNNGLTPVKPRVSKMAGRFEPKTKVDLDPPKDDPISIEDLAKANGK